jgi:methylthioribose-1-phosphate isomerase
MTDSTAATVLRQGKVQAVIVGADRIAANGDAANKIGTYPLAVLAARHGIPFYVAAPTSTIDPATPDGDSIPIEERPPEEVTHIGGRRIAAAGVKVFAPAFDVTPASLITAIITEKAVLRPPYHESIAAVTRERPAAEAAL